MTAAAIIIVGIAIIIWLIRGAFSDRVRAAREDLDELIDAYDKNHHADNDPDVDKRVRDLYANKDD